MKRVYPQSFCDKLGGTPVVAREHLDPFDPDFPQFRNGLFRVGFQRVSNQDMSGVSAIDDNMGGGAFEFADIVGNTVMVQQSIASDKYLVSADNGLHPSSGKVDMLASLRCYPVSNPFRSVCRQSIWQSDDWSASLPMRQIPGASAPRSRSWRRPFEPQSCPGSGCLFCQIQRS